MTPLQALTKIGNCQTQVELPIFKFKRKEYKLVQERIIKAEKYEEAINKTLELLSKEGINSKAKARELLEKVV